MLMKKDQFTSNTQFLFFFFCRTGAKYVNQGLYPDGAIYDSHFVFLIKEVFCFMLYESREFFSVRDATCDMCLILILGVLWYKKGRGKHGKNRHRIVWENCPQNSWKLPEVGNRRGEKDEWRQVEWGRTQHSTPTTNVHFEYVPGLFYSLSSVKHWEPTHVCSFNRKGSVTREASSTESLKISWSRVETLPKEMELEVSLAK